VSMTLASRTMARRQGFIWHEGLDPSQSQFLNRIKAGMYVPLIWKGRVMGVACVDNSDGGTIFTADDLRLMPAVAHYPAMAALLNDYFSALVDAIFKHDGTVDKITGDAILAVFGSPEPDPLRHEKAIRAALSMQSAMTEVTDRRKRRGQVICTIGIGVHSGEVLHGFIGSNDRMELTVIGEAANWTARYCAGAKSGEILISPALHQRLWRYVDAEPTRIETKHEGMLSAYRLMSIIG